jgi:hypothetical protein
MPQVELHIKGDTTTRAVQVLGVIDDPLIYEWLLGEARRVCTRRADKRDDAQENGGGPRILPASTMPLGEPPRT